MNQRGRHALLALSTDEDMLHTLETLVQYYGVQLDEQRSLLAASSSSLLPPPVVDLTHTPEQKTPHHKTTPRITASPPKRQVNGWLDALKSRWSGVAAGSEPSPGAPLLPMLLSAYDYRAGFASCPTLERVNVYFDHRRARAVARARHRAEDLAGEPHFAEDNDDAREGDVRATQTQQTQHLCVYAMILFVEWI